MNKKEELFERMDALLVEAQNIHNRAYILNLEDEQRWIDYQDELNYLSTARKKN